jgi:hypothetical protein
MNLINRAIYITFLLLLTFVIGYSQNVDLEIDTSFTLSLSNKSIAEIADNIGQLTDKQIFFKSEDHEGLRYSIEANNIGLYEALDKMFAETKFSYLEYGDNSIVVVPTYLVSENFSASYFQLLEEISEESDDSRIKRYDGITVGNVENLQPSGKANVSGVVIDGQTGEGIIGATIQWLDTASSGVTDVDGSFTTNVEVGEQILQIQYIGYQTITKKVKILSDGKVDLTMEKEAVSLEEIVISERSASERVESTQISVERISAKEIKKLPSFLGEPDVIQSLLIQPGVSNVGEGSIGFNVRGGDVDQNLIIQDEALIFNTSHALGFFSTFNTDMIKGVDLYKGIIPAQFGGRLASVMDVEMRDGNPDEYKLRAGIGVVSGKLTFEGPIGDKTSFITGLRTSYGNWILGLIDVPEVQNSNASFNDFNGRITHRFSDKSSLILAGYLANDDFNFNNEFGFDYSTKLGQVIYKNAFKDNILSETTLSYSTYQSTQSDFDLITPTDFENNIDYFKFKELITINPSGKFRVNTGFSSILYLSEPGKRISTIDGAQNVVAELDSEKGLESAVFADLKIPVSDKISVSAGLRLSAYQQLGPADVLTYAPDLPRRIENATGSESFDGGVVASYYGIEPRASVRLGVTDNSSVKAGYSRTTQYINQIFNTDSPTPTSQWQLSTTHIEPTRSHNLSIGFFQNLAENNYETSLSIFARRIDKLFDYRDFADLLVNEHLETELLEGEGRAYGAELSIKKKTGVINGSFSYTYSRSQRLVAGINRNDWYSSNFDKPHEGSLVLNFQPNQRNNVSLNFTYAQGRPTTPPVAGFVTPENVFVPIFAERNQERIPDFQRLDISYTFGEGYKKDKKFRLSWTLSVYNILARENAFSVFFSRGAFNVPRAQQLSVLGNAFPALTFQIELL